MLWIRREWTLWSGVALLAAAVFTSFFAGNAWVVIVPSALAGLLAIALVERRWGRVGCERLCAILFPAGLLTAVGLGIARESITDGGVPLLLYTIVALGILSYGWPARGNNWSPT